MSELENELAALKARVAALEARANPPARVETVKLGYEPPFSPSTCAAIDRMCVPKHITDEMVERVPTEVIRQIVKDR
jgi:hypothetical protein